MARQENPNARFDRAVSLIKDMACKILSLEASHIRMVLIKRYAEDENHERTDVLTADAFSQHLYATPQRELIWQGKNNKREDSKEQPFMLFSRRECFTDGGAALILVADNKHGESHELAFVFDDNYHISSIRKGDLLGNDFKYRVGKQCHELTALLKHDRIIHEAINYGS